MYSRLEINKSRIVASCWPSFIIITKIEYETFEVITAALQEVSDLLGYDPASPPKTPSA
jgi:hypothetical protein